MNIEASKPATNEPEATPENQEEKVVGIAIMYNGEIIRGGNHFNLREKLRVAHPDGLQGPIDEGYFTSKERFVSRKEGEEMLKRQRITPAQMAGY